MMMWKIVRVSEDSVIYIFIYIYTDNSVCLSKRNKNTFQFFQENKIANLFSLSPPPFLLFFFPSCKTTITCKGEVKIDRCVRVSLYFNECFANNN